MSLAKVCRECGMPLEMGLAKCPHCGARVGTLFSETEFSAIDRSNMYSRKIAEQTAHDLKIEKAHERANNSVALALASFFCPGVGLLLGIAAIVLGAGAARTLKAYNIEDGRGAATAGVIIGAIALIAQACYLIYVIKVGTPFTG